MRDYLWLPSYESYTSQPLTNAMVKDAEEKLGVKLPTSYIEILRVQNGGETRYDAFPTSLSKWSNGYVPVNAIMGISPNGILRSL